MEIHAGEAVGLIGESGSGKSTLGRLGVGLLHPDSGRVQFAGRELESIAAKDLRMLRSEMQVVFQEPMESLNPRMSVLSIVDEPLLIHRAEMSRDERKARVLQTMEQVGLDVELADRRPRDLSGGQQQRVGIARAIITRPRLVVLDEPVSSLDLSVRALILNLLKDLQAELGLAYLFISHDIHTVHYFCSRTAVVFHGRLMEVGDTETLISYPEHPYTKALLSSRLSVDPEVRMEEYSLKGDPRSPTQPVLACPLVGRCPIEISACSQGPVNLEPFRDLREVACLRVTGSPDGNNAAGES